MKKERPLFGAVCSDAVAAISRAAVVPLLLTLVLAATVKAEDFAYSTNNGAVTIGAYIGLGGDLTIPGHFYRLRWLGP